MAIDDMSEVGRATLPRWFSTFHGFYLLVLRGERDRFDAFGVLSEPEQRRIFARAVRDEPEANSRCYYIGEGGAVRLVADALTLISRTKDESISLADSVECAESANSLLETKDTADAPSPFPATIIYSMPTLATRE